MEIRIEFRSISHSRLHSSTLAEATNIYNTGSPVALTFYARRDTFYARIYAQSSAKMCKLQRSRQRWMVTRKLKLKSKLEKNENF